MSSPFAVLLFDIDGTLVDAGGAGRRALEKALEAHLGAFVRPQKEFLAGVRLDGMTDRLIVREATMAAGHPYDEALCDRILDSYGDELERGIADTGYRVLPGVEDLLCELRNRDIVFGLCTGNILRGARIKLSRGGLDRYFRFRANDIHGFGSDGEARERIIEAALHRASERLGRRILPKEALIVGDTPRDIAAARSTGCPVLAVATGRFGVEALRAEGANHVVPSLEGAGVTAFMLGNA